MKYVVNPYTKLYMPFDSNANDLSGNANNGTVTGATLVAGGRFGKAYSFNGSSDLITIANAASLRPAGDFTIISIFKSSGSNNYPGIFHSVYSDRNSVVQGIITRLNANKTISLFIFPNLATYIDVATTNEYDKSNWNFFVATSNSTTKTVYLNGVKRVFSSNVTQTYNASNRVVIGCNDASTVPSDRLFFAGTIDSVILENRCWSEADVQKFYQQNFRPAIQIF